MRLQEREHQNSHFRDKSQIYINTALKLNSEKSWSYHVRQVLLDSTQKILIGLISAKVSQNDNISVSRENNPQEISQTCKIGMTSLSKWKTILLNPFITNRSFNSKSEKKIQCITLFNNP